jgi:ribosomal protein S18 acetylase RimI-like enzyme
MFFIYLLFTNKMVVFEKAKDKDIRQIAEFFYLLSKEDGLKVNKKIFLKNNINYLKEVINNKDFLILVAKINKNIVGTSLSRILFPRKPLMYEKKGEISRIFIKKEYRGKGIGFLLIERNKQFFKRFKIKKIRVFVFKQNEKAQSFWRHLNFKELTNILEFNL